ncbi:MAG: hypothetical protein U0521_14115 [Anaerolineae bacterium]
MRRKSVPTLQPSPTTASRSRRVPSVQMSGSTATELALIRLGKPHSSTIVPVPPLTGPV